jgi:hypothetical protein
MAEQGEARRRQRRQGQRRRVERRRSFRIIYPLSLAPEMLNSRFRVMNLSQEGIMLRWEGRKHECPVSLMLGSVISLQIQFHDGETLDLTVKVNRCQSDRRSRMRVFAGTLEPALTAARINKEERYLLRSVPDFCRVEWHSTGPVVEE